MRKLKSLRLVVVLSVIAGLVVAACGGADPTPTPAPTATSVPAPTATPAPTPTPLPPPTDVGVSKGGTLTLADRGSSSGLEPILSRLPANLRWVAPMYTRLIQLDESDDLAPLLAETWSVEENGTRFTFNLRDSVTFHDGTPLTAEDVAYSWDKMANPPEGTSSLFSSVFGPIIDTIAAPDATTVVITTTNTVGWFLGHVPVVSIVPKHAHEPVAADGGFTDTGLGSGPFVFESYTPKVELVMTANPDYFEAGLPFLDEIRWPFIAESQAMIAALISGRLLHSGSTDLTQEQVDAIKAQLSDLQVYTAPRGITIGIGFNHNNPNLANPKIREALVIAMDERDIIDVAYPGGVFPGTFFPGAGRFGIPEDEWNDYAMYGFGKSRDERLEMAKQMLDEAGATDLKFLLDKPGKEPALEGRRGRAGPPAAHRSGDRAGGLRRPGQPFRLYEERSLRHRDVLGRGNGIRRTGAFLVRSLVFGGAGVRGWRPEAVRLFEPPHRRAAQRVEGDDRHCQAHADYAGSRPPAVARCAQQAVRVPDVGQRSRPAGPQPSGGAARSQPLALAGRLDRHKISAHRLW